MWVSSDSKARHILREPVSNGLAECGASVTDTKTTDLPWCRPCGATQTEKWRRAFGLEEKPHLCGDITDSFKGLPPLKCELVKGHDGQHNMHISHRWPARA